MEMIWHGPTQADGHPEVPTGGWQRIACLSTEAVEILYRLGAQDRIVGISGFTVHPPEARHEKPKISGFTSAVLAEGVDAAAAERQFARFGAFYQGDVHEPRPLFAREAA